LDLVLAGRCPVGRRAVRWYPDVSVWIPVKDSSDINFRLADGRAKPRPTAMGAELDLGLSLRLPGMRLHIVVIRIGWYRPEPTAQRVHRRSNGKFFLLLVDYDHQFH